MNQVQCSWPLWVVLSCRGLLSFAATGEQHVLANVHQFSAQCAISVAARWWQADGHMLVTELNGWMWHYTDAVVGCRTLLGRNQLALPQRSTVDGSRYCACSRWVSMWCCSYADRVGSLSVVLS